MSPFCSIGENTTIARLKKNEETTAAIQTTNTSQSNKTVEH